MFHLAISRKNGCSKIDRTNRAPNNNLCDAREKVESYLIRIYRRDFNNPEVITGTVGKIGTEETVAFKNLAELGEIIIGKKKRERQRASQYEKEQR
jgi:hypothetical protein